MNGKVLLFHDTPAQWLQTWEIREYCRRVEPVTFHKSKQEGKSVRVEGIWNDSEF